MQNLGPNDNKQRIKPFKVGNDINYRGAGSPSAVIEIEDIDGGFLTSKVTVLQRDAIVDPAIGLLIFNTDNNIHEWWDGTMWLPLGAGGGGGGSVLSVHGRVGHVIGEYGDYTADLIEVTPAGSMTATDVQTALEELYVVTDALITGGTCQKNITAPLYTTVLDDAGCDLYVADPTAVTFTIPNDTTTAFLVNTKIDVVQMSSGSITFVGEAGVVLLGDVSTDGQYHTVSIWKKAPNEWLIVGTSDYGSGGGGGGGTGAVDSVFGRTGDVIAVNGDYTASQITNVPSGNIIATDVQGALDEIQTELDIVKIGYLCQKNEINTIYTLGITDAGCMITMDNAAAINLFIPDNATTPFEINTRIDVVQWGAGAITFTPSAGVVMRGDIDTNGQYHTISLWKKDVDEWLIIGSGSPAAGGGTGAVDSVFGRTGHVIAMNGDYTAAQVTNTLFGNLTTTNVQASMEVISSGYLGQNTQTGTAYTLALADAGSIVKMDNAAAITVTIPDNATVAFPVDYRIDVIQWGAGEVTFTGAAGVTVLGDADTNGQYHTVSVWQEAPNQWVIVGGGNLSGGGTGAVDSVFTRTGDVIAVDGDYTASQITNVPFGLLTDIEAQSALETIGSGYLGQNAQTGTTYTFALADAGSIITMDNAAAITATIPDNATVAFPVDYRIDIIQWGAGAITFTGAAGVTVLGDADTNGQYHTVSIWQQAVDQWVVIGGGNLSGGGTGAVDSVFTRTGDVIAVAGDYTASEITNVPAGGMTAIESQAAMDIVAAGYTSKNEQLGTGYVLAATDAGGVIYMDNAAAITLTVPDNAAVAIPVNTQIDIIQDGAGAITLAGNIGVIINGTLTTATQGDIISLVKKDLNEWYSTVVGSGAAGAVTSVHARTGAVVSADDDYNASQIENIPAGGLLAVDVQTAINKVASGHIDQNFQVGTAYTLSLSDAGGVVDCDNGGAITITIPTNAAVALPINCRIDILQMGAGVVTANPTGGVTLHGDAKTNGQYHAVTLWKRSTDEWVVIGGVA